MRRAFPRGFTLIELLVVVSIIGILLAVSIPSYTGYLSRAYNTSAAQDAASFRLSQSTFRAQYGVFSKGVGCLCRLGFMPSKDGGGEVVMTGLGAVAAGSYAVVFKHPKGARSTTATQAGLAVVECGGPCGGEGTSEWDWMLTAGDKCPPDNQEDLDCGPCVFGAACP